MLLATILFLSLLSPIHSSLNTNLDEALGQTYRFLDHLSPIQLPLPLSGSVLTRDFTEILVWNESVAFVGAANFLFRIDSDLNIEAAYNGTINTTASCFRRVDIFLDTCDNYFRVLLNISNNLYTCYTNRATPVCLSLSTSLQSADSPPFFQQVDAFPMGYISPTLPLQLSQRNFIIYIPENASIVTGSVFSSNELNRITVMDPTTLTYRTTTFYIPTLVNMVKEYLDIASFARVAHNYLDGGNNYIYFMFYEPSDRMVAGVSKSRVARFCLQGPSNPNPAGTIPNELPLMDTFIKVELSCGTAFPSLVQDWLYFESGAELYYYAVFSSLDRGPNASYLCVYNFTSIRDRMSAVKTCGDNRANFLEIAAAIEPIAMYSGSVPTIGHVGALFTQIQRYPLTFNATLYDIVYVSLTNGSIVKYCISCPSQRQKVDMIQVVPTRLLNGSLSSIDKLQLASDYLLAGGYTGLYKVPLQTCSSLGQQYQMCLLDPMCYFDLIWISCKPVYNYGFLNNSMLHFAQFLTSPIPAAPNCSSLTGYFQACTNELSYSWNCIADEVFIIIIISNGNEFGFRQSSGTGSGVVTMDFDLDSQSISSFSVEPFSDYLSFPTSLIGPQFFSNLTFLFTDCPPSAIICAEPVCEDNTSCSDGCSRVGIDCSLGNVSSSLELTYNITSGDVTTEYSISNLNQPITVEYSRCGSNSGCLFQTFSRNSTTGLTTQGSSHWLNLLPPFSTFAPTIGVDQTTVVNNQLNFNARFPQFYTHTCETPTIVTFPASSPFTITECSTVIRANGSIGSDSSRMANLTVEFSQAALPPTSVQLTINFKSIKDDCSSISDVIVQWAHPSYAIPSNTGLYQYRIYGSACNTDYAGGAVVTGATNYTCQDVALSYNVDYSIIVVSYEPCGMRASAFNSTTQKSASGPPGSPLGLGYEFTGNNVTISWSSPLCTNSDFPVQQYNLKFYKLCSSTSTMLFDQNITDTSMQFELDAERGSFRYRAFVASLTSQEISNSVQISFTFPDDSGGVVCRMCRVRTLSISSTNIWWTITQGCGGLDITEFIISTSNGNTETDILTVDGNSRSNTTDLCELNAKRISIRLNIQEQSNSSCAQCTSQQTHAFVCNNLCSSMRRRRAVSNSSSLTSDSTCQDDKAYIIVALAGLAIVCAIGNIGCMIIAFCVFFIPRRKVFC